MKVQQDAYQIISCVTIQYGTQLYCLILFIRTFKFRRTLAGKVIKYLKLAPFFTDKLLIIKITYSNVRILEFLILILISATVSVCVFIVFNLNINDITSIIVTEYTNKTMKGRLFSFIPIVQNLMIFSMLKRLLVFMAEVSFNSTLILLRKIERIKILVNQIKKVKKCFLSCLKSTTLYRFFSFQLFRRRANYYGLRWKCIYQLWKYFYIYIYDGSNSNCTTRYT